MCSHSTGLSRVAIEEQALQVMSMFISPVTAFEDWVIMWITLGTTAKAEVASGKLFSTLENVETSEYTMADSGFH